MPGSKWNKATTNTMKILMQKKRLALLAVLSVAAVVGAAEPSTVWDGVFNSAQVKRAATVYAAQCEPCHGATLDGGDAPPLSGRDFLANWNGFSVGDLYEKTRNTMPATEPKS